MRVGFATSDWSTKALDPLTDRPSYGGAGWARCGLIARHLRALGDFEVFEGTLTFHKPSGTFGVREWPAHDPEGEDVTYQTDLDLIVMQRWMFASVAAEILTARRKGQVIVQDVDDHFWALDSRNRADKATDPLIDQIENRDHYLRAIQASSAVTTTTPYLADVLRRLGVRCPIHVLENRIDVEAFAWVGPEEKSWGRRPVIGWVGAIPWRSGDLETLKGVLGPFLERHDLRAYHGGHVNVWETVEYREGDVVTGTWERLDETQTFAHQTGVDPLRVRKRAMVPIFEYPRLFEPLDVGLVPLRDAHFNRAKSWLKGLEYAAAGVPFVAQDLPEYRRLRDDFDIGRVARRPRDWTRHLAALLDDDFRLSEARHLQEAAQVLDIRRGIGHWRDLYLDLLVNAGASPPSRMGRV